MSLRKYFSGLSANTSYYYRVLVQGDPRPTPTVTVFTTKSEPKELGGASGRAGGLEAGAGEGVGAGGPPGAVVGAVLVRR